MKKEVLNELALNPDGVVARRLSRCWHGGQQHDGSEPKMGRPGPDRAGGHNRLLSGERTERMPVESPSARHCTSDTDSAFRA
jgi:hypothetical protein